jgi:uncharacterized protein
MVLEIRLRNFFSIKDEIVLDLRAAAISSSAAKNLSNNYFEINKYKLLKTVTMYGANASGKSNIIKAIRFCNAMVFESDRHNENTIYNFQPFKFKGLNKKPSYYLIRFINNGVEFEYSFSLTRTQIITESLFYYPKGRKSEVFSRNELAGDSKKDKYSFQSVIKRPMDVAQNTSNKTLFISRASQMDREIAKDVFNYFHDKFILRYFEFGISAIESLSNQNKKRLIEALRIADSDIVDLKIKVLKKEGKHINANLTDLKLSVEDVIQDHLQIKSFHKTSPNTSFDFFTEESSGTIKLFFIMLTILDIVKNDKILLIDEIGESLHTDIIQYIFNLFNASDKAQLICTTHNTNFLDLKKFRKDQIYFVNKNDQASTDLYSLFDYSDFRDTMNLEKAYLQGRFDAIPFVNDSIENLKSIING